MADPIDIFISYKLEERHLAEQVMRALRQAGYIAVTNFNIAKSQEFGDAIDKMIRSARLTLVIWTQKSTASDWVRKEARLAYELEKAGKPNRYLGVMVENVALDMPVDLRGLQMVDLTVVGLTATTTGQIIEAVRERIGPGATVSAEVAETKASAAMDEFQLYEYARALDVASAYEHFLTIYPNGKFATDARRDLHLARVWYMHPFRRGSVGHTLTALSIAVAALSLVWGASQQSGSGGIAREVCEVTVAERNETRAALKLAEVNLAERERRLAEAAAEVAAKSAKLLEAEALAKSLEDRVDMTANGRQATERALLDEQSRNREELSRLKYELNVLSSELARAEERARNDSLRASRAEMEIKGAENRIREMELSFKDRLLRLAESINSLPKDSTDPEVNKILDRLTESITGLGSDITSEADFTSAIPESSGNLSTAERLARNRKLLEQVE